MIYVQKGDGRIGQFMKGVNQKSGIGTSGNSNANALAGCNHAITRKVFGDSINQIHSFISL